MSGGYALFAYLLCRKRAVLEIGGFDEGLPIHYDTDILLRLSERRKQSVIFDEDLFSLHLEGDNRFLVRSFLRRNFVFGYWIHMLFYKHRRRIGLRGWPWSTLFLLGTLAVSLYLRNVVLLILIVGLALSYRVFQIRGRLSLVWTSFPSFSVRLSAFVCYIALSTLDVLASDAGKLVALFDKARGRPNYTFL